MTLCTWLPAGEKFHCPRCGAVRKNRPLRECRPGEVAAYRGVKTLAEKSTRETILEFLTAHPGATIGQIVSTCMGCKDKIAQEVKELAKEGVIVADNEFLTGYSIKEN